jgi:glycosyltransferase involved in cell wall biosynthesis
MVVMRHGNYNGAYPPPRPREDVLHELSLPAGNSILLCVGQLRPYKGFDIACRAVAELGTGVSLILAGGAAVGGYHDQIESLVRTLPNALLVEGDLTDQQYCDLVAASDLVLLPYRSVTGSGAALAALTLGRGIVASDLPFFADLLRGDHYAGRLFARGSAHAMARTITEFLTVSPTIREEAARRLASRFDWDRVVEPVVHSLRCMVAPELAANRPDAPSGDDSSSC